MISDVLSLLIHRHAECVRLCSIIRIVGLYLYSLCLVEGSDAEFFLSEEVLKLTLHLLLHDD